jgi:hypothetical protein
MSRANVSASDSNDAKSSVISLRRRFAVSKLAATRLAKASPRQVMIGTPVYSVSLTGLRFKTPRDGGAASRAGRHPE